MASEEPRSEVVVRMSREALRIIQGKAVVVLIAGTLFGWTIAQQQQPSSLDDPVADRTPVVVQVLVTVALCAAVAVAYEALGRVVAGFLARNDARDAPRT